MISDILTESIDNIFTKDYRLFYYKKKDNKINDKSTVQKISLWHDIPLHFDKSKCLFNYINEIPKGTTAKMEVATNEHFTPIKQDITSNNELRYFKAGKIPFNYGCFPQTWEDPSHIHPDTGYPGDGDPLDALEITDISIPIGQIVQVKPIGLIGLVDSDETDWKIVCVGTFNPHFDEIHTIADIKRLYPGFLKKVKNWFLYYKTYDGKKENKLIYNGKIKSMKYALKIIDHTHKHWKYDYNKDKYENKN